MLKDKLRWKDVRAIWAFALAWPFAACRRRRQKNLWLVSERPAEARDNGWWFYRYVREQHPEQAACYVIRRDSSDRARLEPYGNLIEFGSFRHYITYLAARCHISAHVDSDSPNSRVSNFLETHGMLRNKRVFLQHGVTKDKISFGYYAVSRADLFVCAAKPEWEFCNEEFGYPDGAVQLLGFARFDGLGTTVPQRKILLMPTWRAWLAGKDGEAFVQSEYFKCYQALLKNANLHQMLKEHDTRLVFYPHPDMQPFVSAFSCDCPEIAIADAASYDIQTLLNESAALITDYSSVAFDMAYMEKPVCYYQFDYEDYRSGQHPEGYFSYERDGFGPVCRTEEAVLASLEQMLTQGTPQPEYLDRIQRFFPLRDKQNCARIYAAIQGMESN